MDSSVPPTDPLFVEFQAALAGRYSIDRELGRGGMGVVYLAHEVHLDRPVAIKLLPPDRARDPALRERFLREARMAAKLSHPNIIPIHAVDDATGFVYYVMAYVEGETLANRVRTRGPLPNSEGARVLRDAAWALAHAHAQGLVHRDVKPDNILLEAGTGRVMVADFGIAAVASDPTGEGVSGTPEFMSPEQALGQDVDGRSDLYSLGATAFFAMTGRLPFEGKTPTEVLAKQVTEPAPPVLSMGIPVSRKIAALIDRCLAKEPEQRPASAEAMAEQLGVALEQRKELPMALRTFAKRHARLDGGGSLLTPIILLTTGAITARFIGPLAGLGVFAGGMIVVPTSYFIHVAREMLQLGFTHADAVPAFTAEVEQGREERALDRWRGPSLVERGMTALSVASAAIFIATIVVSAATSAWIGPTTLGIWTALNTTAFAFGALTGTSLIAKLALLQGRRDVDSEFWLKVWGGRIGKFAFAAAKRLTRGNAVATVMTHRATELALGMAAENLFETLPRETRASLGDLPAILRRLQNDAQQLRVQYNELQEALAEAPGGGPAEAYAEVRETRDVIQAKLTEAVGALETIRLNLLRLHAGSATVEGLTTHLNIAADVSAEVQRLLAAREEVEHHLQFPREIATTPA